MKIAVLGAEKTGKTQLAAALASGLSAGGQPAICVPDALGEWRLRHGREPLRHEQQGLAEEQVRRVRVAGPTPMLVADNTALMTAIHRDRQFGDTSLYAFALEHQRDFDLVLLTGLDLPWVASSMQSHARESIDRRLRQVLDEQTMKYAVVYGTGVQRAACALQAIARHGGSPVLQPNLAHRPWRGYCEKCSDPECEHKMFTRQLGIGHPSRAADATRSLKKDQALTY